MKRGYGFLALIGGLIVLSCANADSIWDRREPRSAFLFYDSRPRRIGDVVTIIIQETTGINNTDQHKLNRATNAAGTFNFKGDSAAQKNTRSASADFSAQGTANRGFQGNSAFTINQVFTDRMSVIVVDVLPNGNLVVEGFRKRYLDREERIIRITGIVRPIDILLDNTVFSQFVADLEISYVGKGPDTKFTNQNYFSRILNLLWPW
jgi:flagellar L-ring protein precursor FlgH